ncbi:APC family permease [Streptomyces sp. ICBB 8177]|uniref:APC family permease n=1 Tax=Streptomyces sp. ICBB 8177 TaxID=563922 RepID=UPI000D683726|nr:APC family permease [Streptomyces sp. ICBB 8177]PWI41913.1 amino acid permease [Streptomyces sp. ICBB 8177]
MAATDHHAPATTDGGFVRRIGQFQASAINMSQMVGIGPFITIPAMVLAFGGPQAVVGWIAGAVLALADGLIWAELGASLPGAGGSYIYLREAFQYRTGRLMPFLFTWTAMLFIPLIMSTGVAGFVQYLTYLWPSMTKGQGDLVGLAMCVAVVLLLWRRIESIGKLASMLWIVMIVSVASVIVAAFTHFHASDAFSYPPHAFALGTTKFWLGFASGLTIGIYDYLGYNTTAYMGAEIKNPGRVLPRSIIYAIFGVMGIYLLMQIGVLGVVSWKDMIDPNNPASQSVAAVVLQRAWGKGTANVITVLILVTAFTSVFAGLLGGSRVPYDAARDKVFFRQFGRLHPKHRFPTLSLLAMGVITAGAFYFSRHVGTSAKTPPLTVLITLLTTVMVIVQAFAQIAAVTVLRRRQPNLARPYKMWLYPLPSVVALVGWLTVYVFADKNNPGLHPIEWSLGWVALGVIAFLVWARREHTWPFGPKDIREDFLKVAEGLDDEPTGDGEPTA